MKLKTTDKRFLFIRYMKEYYTNYDTCLFTLFGKNGFAYRRVDNMVLLMLFRLKIYKRYENRWSFLVFKNKWAWT